MDIFRENTNTAQSVTKRRKQKKEPQLPEKKLHRVKKLTLETEKMTTINFEDIKLADEERQPCEVWTRVMGYFRPVSEFNKGKKSEFYSRVCFSESKAVCGGCCDHMDIAAE